MQLEMKTRAKMQLAQNVKFKMVSVKIKLELHFLGRRYYHICNNDKEDFSNLV